MSWADVTKNYLLGEFYSKRVPVTEPTQQRIGELSLQGSELLESGEQILPVELTLDSNQYEHDNAPFLASIREKLKISDEN